MEDCACPMPDQNLDLNSQEDRARVIMIYYDIQGHTDVTEPHGEPRSWEFGRRERMGELALPLPAYQVRLWRCQRKITARVLPYAVLQSPGRKGTFSRPCHPTCKIHSQGWIQLTLCLSFSTWPRTNGGILNSSYGTNKLGIHQALLMSQDSAVRGPPP